jgi:hypothetical protein
MHISDRWHPRFFDIPRTVETGKPVLRDDILLGDDEVRQKDLEFAARMHDFQQGRFNAYFAFGRTGRVPETYAWHPEEATWRLLEIYDLMPAVGVLQLDGEGRRIWLFGNGWEQPMRLRMKASSSEMLQSTLEKAPQRIDFKGGKYLEIELSPLEFGVIEWKYCSFP